MNQKLDNLNDAMRDLRYNYDGGAHAPSPPYGDLPDDGVYLFGGYETRNLDDTYYSNDFNANGQIDNYYVNGLSKNLNNLPSSTDYSWVVSNAEFLGIYVGGDYAVRLDRQYPWDDTGTIGDTVMIHLSHDEEPQDVSSIMRGLDEPDTYQLAYDIRKDTKYMGFMNYQENYQSADFDYYRFIASVNGKLKIIIDGLNSGVNGIVLLDQSGNLINFQAIGSFPLIYERDVNAGLYYVGISGNASSTGTLTPYTILPTLEPLIISLYNGSITPTTGDATTNFIFSVYYKNTNNVTPDNVQLHIINQFSENMTANGSNWQDGVLFTKILNGFAVGQYQYYFSATVSGQELRYPDSGYLDFNVLQNAAGWDLRVSNLTHTPTIVMPSSNFTSTGYVHNNSNSLDKIYYNVGYSFTFYDPSGNIIGTPYTGTISQITQYQTVSITKSFTAPSTEGNCQLVFTVYPQIDENTFNNTLSNTVIVSETGSQNQWLTTSINYKVNMNSGYPTHQFMDHSYTLTLANNTTIDIKREDRTNPDHIDELNFRKYDGETIVVINEECSTGDAYVSFGSNDLDNVSYEATTISTNPGTTIEFIAHSSSSQFYGTAPIIYQNNDGAEVASWFDSYTRIDGNLSIKYTFNIPGSAGIDTYKFYLNSRLTSGDRFLRYLEIKVIAPPPNITSISSNYFSADDQITITGTNFGTSGSVKFNDLAAASIVSWTSTQIKAIVPVGVQSGNLFVTNSNGISNGVTYTVKSSTGAPIVVAPIPDQSIYVNDIKFIANLNNVFSEPNNQPLTFSASSTNQNILVKQDSISIGKLYLQALVNATGTSTITVTATDPTNKSATDEFLLTIIPTQQPLIIVTSPNGGENWSIGSLQNIEWISYGTSGNVRIELSKDNGNTWLDLFSNILDDGTENWTVSGPPSSQCKVRVSDIDGVPLDTSDNFFNIIMSNSSPTLTWTAEPSYESDGVNPDEGNTSSTFTFRLKYTDADDDAPQSGYPKLHLKKGNVEIATYDMTQVLGENPPGIKGIGTEQLQNEILDKKNTGEVFELNNKSKSKNESLDINGNVLNKKGPMISELFELPNNPQVNSFMDGVIYTVDVAGLSEGSDYSYYFEAYDVNGNLATGEATVEQSGPVVTSSYWTQQISNTTDELRSVFFINEQIGWALASTGVVLKTIDGGQNWNQIAVAGTDYMLACYFVDQNTGWIAGSAGNLLRTTDGGVSWTQQLTQNYDDFYSLFFINSSTGWCTGLNASEGIILKTTDSGQNWFQQTTNATFIRAIYFTDVNNGWAAGSDVVLNTTNGGSNWTTSLTDENTLFTSIVFNDLDNGWASGVNSLSGIVYKTTDGGNNWASNTLNEFDWLLGSDFVNCSGWAVGFNANGGIISHTNDCGESWNVQVSGNAVGDKSAFFINEYKGWAVGNNGIIMKYDAPVLNQNPTVNITSPTEGEIFTQPAINVNGIANDPDGTIAQVLVQLNGGIWETASGTNSWSHPLNLVEGNNAIYVKAIDNLGGSSNTLSVTIIYSPNQIPILTWTGEPGYETDGVNPDTGDVNTTFTFRVKYTDADDDAPQSGYPKLHLKKAGVEIATYDMTQVLGENPLGSNEINKGQLQNEVLELKNNSKSKNELLDKSENIKSKKGPMISELFELPNNPQANSFIDGVIYTVDVPGLLEGSDYTYYFEAIDVNGDTATGEATIEQSGPIVSIVSNWIVQNSGVAQNLNSVFFVDSLNGWAVGDEGIIIHTTDGGATWSQQTSGTSNNLYSLAFTDKNIGYVVGDATILKTIDGGLNWLPYTTSEDLRSVSFANNINGWAASYTGAILRTQNGGSTWVEMRAGGTSQLNAIEFINSKIGWAVGADYLILKSTDAGTSWTTVLNAPVGHALRNINFIDVKRGWAIGSNDNGEVIKSTDGATTWATQTNYLNTVYWAIQFIDSSKGWMVGNESESKIINTTDGGTSWNIEPTNSGSNLSSISISPTGPAWVVGEGGLILKNSTIFIPPLLRVTSPNGGEVLEAGKSILISWWDNFEGNVKISLFQGSTFIKYLTNDTPNDGEYYWVIPDSLLPASNYQIKIISKNNVSITDKSDGFFSVVTPTTPYVTVLYPNGGETFEAGLTYSIKWYDNFEDSVKISLFRGPEFIQYLSTGTPSDGEFSWTFPIETIPDSTYQIKIINKKTSSILDKSDESFKITEGTSVPFIHVLSPNDGENWQVGTTHDITWDDNISDNVKIALFKGSTLYKTLSNNNPSNGLYSWTIDPTITPATNYKIKITRKSDKTLFDKSDKNFTISASGFAKELAFMNEIPTEFKLFQNYPNPFNPNTQIIYGIPEDSNVKIEIFNLLGELVEVLTDEFKTAGYYTENLNIKKSSSGIYIYRIQAGPFVETKKMILMK